MSATTGYFRAGSSWLHHRHPITKALAVAVVLLAAFLLPAWFLLILLAIVVVAATSSGLAGPLIASLRIPALLLTSILVINALFFPGATDRLLTLGPLSVTREGLGFGLISAGRLLVAFMTMVLFLFTTLADDLLETLIERGASHRIAFVVLSAVQMVPRMQARTGSILDAQQARGLSVQGSFLTRLRALVPLIGPVLLGSLIDVRERTFALEARGFGARGDRTAYRQVADPPGDRVVRWSLAAAGAVVVFVAVTGLLR